jgi:hypothetical protein
MPSLKNFLIIACLFSLAISSCKKPSDVVGNPLLEQFFELNVLNRNFTVSLATNETTDLTSDFSGYTFVLQKDDYYHGPLKATKGSNVYMGTWSCNEDYGKLTITLPTPPDNFIFLNRAWRFTSKNFPTMKLAPWGSTANIVLHMYRQ